MKTIFTILFVYSAKLILSQSPNYDDLKILYADTKYEKLSKVAAHYTQKDKTSKDVLPYIWLSKGLYKISLSGSDNPKFKNAYKDAIKYLSKGIKYDVKYNNGSTFEDDHKEFLDEFQFSLQEIIDNEMSSNNVKRAFSWAIKYQKITMNPIGANYIMGACKFMDQDKTTARAYWQKGDAMMEEIKTINKFSEADRLMFKNGVLSTAEAMVKSRQIKSAKILLNKASHWFEKDEDWEEIYDEILNQ